MPSDEYVKQIEADLVRERVARRIVDEALRDQLIQLTEARKAIRVLAKMAKNSPSYEVTVKPFADAHQEACALLAQLQEQGFEEAN